MILTIWSQLWLQSPSTTISTSTSTSTSQPAVSYLNICSIHGWILQVLQNLVPDMRNPELFLLQHYIKRQDHFSHILLWIWEQSFEILDFLTCNKVRNILVIPVSEKLYCTKNLSILHKFYNKEKMKCVKNHCFLCFSYQSFKKESTKSPSINKHSATDSPLESYLCLFCRQPPHDKWIWCISTLFRRLPIKN